MSASAGILFIALVAVTLGITYWAGQQNKSVESHLVAAGHISGRQNGVAIAGDFISAATFLGTTGAIALGGFNGFFLAIYIPAAYLLCLLLVAEPLRNLGHFTLGDVLAVRFHGNDVRAAIAITSVVISLLYMVAQFVGAALLLYELSLMGVGLRAVVEFRVTAAACLVCAFRKPLAVVILAVLRGRNGTALASDDATPPRD